MARETKYQKALNAFVDAHNAVLANPEPTESEKIAQVWAAMKLLEATPDAGGPAGELDFDALMAEASARFDADIKRPAVRVAVPTQLASGPEYTEAHNAAVAEAEAAYQAKVDQTLAIAGGVVKAFASLAAGGVL